MNLDFKKIRLGEKTSFVLGAVFSPMYLILINNPYLIPDSFLFIKPRVSGALHLFVQLILCELLLLILALAYKNSHKENRRFYITISWFFLMFFVTKSGWIINEAAIVASVSFILGDISENKKISNNLIRIMLLVIVQIIWLLRYW